MREQECLETKKWHAKVNMGKSVRKNCAVAVATGGTAAISMMENIAANGSKIPDADS